MTWLSLFFFWVFLFLFAHMSPKQEWEWESAGFGRPRKALGLPMEVGPTFEDRLDELEAAQASVEHDDASQSASRRKLMETVTVQTAQFALLHSKNRKALEKKKDYQYYELPRIYRVRPVMTEKLMTDLINKNTALLEEMTELVKKNEELASLETMPLAEYA
jgi:hypothetical protein